MTIDEFATRLRARAISSLEMTEECLARIASDNPRLNAFILVMAEQARENAREADAQFAAGRDLGPLHGVPVSIKDLVDIRGTATTAASHVRDGHVAEHDAPVITRLRHAGAVLIGKTNLHEFAFGTTNEDSGYGPARNPFDPARSPGGSSGGSAISVATGMALGSVGTDTGGSVRIPAAACGLVGFKPTLGEIPTEDVVPLSRTLDHVGPLAGSVSGTWHMYHAMLGRMATHPLMPEAVNTLRLGVLRGYFCDLLDDEVRSRFEEAVTALETAGAHIENAEIAHAATISNVYVPIVLGDAAAYHAATLESMPDRYTPPVRKRLEMGRGVLAMDYVRALEGRETLRAEVTDALARVDALLLPTLPIPAPLLGVENVTIGSSEQPIRSLMLRLTQLFNLTGHPSIALPCGRTSSGLPCSLQVVGARTGSESLLRTAAAIEAVLGFAASS